MALFGSKKKAAPAKKASKKEVVTTAAATNVPVSAQDLSTIIDQVRITEKASMVQMNGVYVFNVAVDATKNDIMKAVRQIYKVTPRKVSIINIRPKTRRNARTGRTGFSAAGKKAYVYLKKGDTMNV